MTDDEQRRAHNAGVFSRRARAALFQHLDRFFAERDHNNDDSWARFGVAHFYRKRPTVAQLGDDFPWDELKRLSDLANDR